MHHPSSSLTQLGTKGDPLVHTRERRVGRSQRSLPRGPQQALPLPQIAPRVLLTLTPDDRAAWRTSHCAPTPNPRPEQPLLQLRWCPSPFLQHHAQDVTAAAFVPVFWTPAMVHVCVPEPSSTSKWKRKEHTLLQHWVNKKIKRNLRSILI